MEQKRVSLLMAQPASPKPKKEPKTHSFELKLGESNDQTYPEFSWTDLVQDSEIKETKVKAQSGLPLLNPYASDDEDDLKALAAKFEAKYATPAVGRKRKRNTEDFVDKGAGYDESDSFIDNSDIYDEIVPIDVQPVHGGFYINSGALDFKQVEISDDDFGNEDHDSDGNESKPSKQKKLKPDTKAGVGSNSLKTDVNHVTSIIKQVSRSKPDAVMKSETSLVKKGKPQITQKRRGSNSSTGSNSANMKNAKIAKTSETKVSKPKRLPKLERFASDSAPSRSRSSSPSKKKLTKISTPTTISITSTSETESTSTDTSDEDDDVTSKSSDASDSAGPHNRGDAIIVSRNPSKKQPIRSDVSFSTSNQYNQVPHESSPLTRFDPNTSNNTSLNLTKDISTEAPQPARRLKVKNVPLNPKLHGKGGVSMKLITPVPAQTLKSVLPSNSNSSRGANISLPPLLMHQKSAPTIDLFSSNVSTKDNNQQNLPRPPTLTPAPMMSAGTSAGTNAPPLKKLTNRMSCGSTRALIKPQNMKERKSEIVLPTLKSGSPVKTSVTASSRSLGSPNLNTATSRASTLETIMNNVNKNKISVSQSTFNKIRKAKRPPSGSNVPSMSSNTNNLRQDSELKLNPKHATNVLPTSLVDSNYMQLQQRYTNQILLAAAVSSASNFNYNRQSVISSPLTNSGVPNFGGLGMTSKTKPSKFSPIMNALPSTSSSMITSSISSQFKNLPQLSEIKDRSKASSSRSSTTAKNNQSQRNVSITSTSAFPVQSTSTSLANFGSNVRSANQHITSYDVNALLGSNKKSKN